MSNKERERKFEETIENIKHDFLLRDKELFRLTKSDPSNFKKRVKELDKVREDMIKSIGCKNHDLHEWLFTHNEDLGMSYYETLIMGDFDLVLEDLAEVNQLFSAFQNDFQLVSLQVRVIMKPDFSGYKERLKMMDKVREIMTKAEPQKKVRHAWLFSHHKKLWDTPFDKMFSGEFDKVIEVLSDLKNNSS